MTAYDGTEVEFVGGRMDGQTAVLHGKLPDEIPSPRGDEVYRRIWRMRGGESRFYYTLLNAAGVPITLA